jgi:hypothetical protein
MAEACGSGRQGFAKKGWTCCTTISSKEVVKRLRNLVGLYEAVRCVPDCVRFDTKTCRKGVASIMATGLRWPYALLATPRVITGTHR